MVHLCFVTAHQTYNQLIQRISLLVSPYTVFYIQYKGKELHFIYGKKLESLCIYVHILPECAVCVRVMFNNNKVRHVAYIYI